MSEQKKNVNRNVENKEEKKYIKIEKQNVCIWMWTQSNSNVCCVELNGLFGIHVACVLHLAQQQFPMENWTNYKPQNSILNGIYRA